MYTVCYQFELEKVTAGMCTWEACAKYKKHASVDGLFVVMVALCACAIITIHFMAPAIA